MFDIVPFKRKNGIRSIFDDFEKEFASNFFNDGFLTSNFSSFRADIKDNNDSYLIEAELPGFSKEDITVSINSNKLTISAKKNQVIDETNENFIRKERHFGEFSRTFVIDNVDEEKINASYKNGILELNLPKLSKDEKNNIRKIDIN